MPCTLVHCDSLGVIILCSGCAPPGTFDVSALTTFAGAPVAVTISTIVRGQAPVPRIHAVTLVDVPHADCGDTPQLTHLVIRKEGVPNMNCLHPVIQDVVLFVLRLHGMVAATSTPPMRFAHVQTPALACGFACDARTLYLPADRALRATVHIDVMSDI